MNAWLILGWGFLLYYNCYCICIIWRVFILTEFFLDVNHDPFIIPDRCPCGFTTIITVELHLSLKDHQPISGVDRNLLSWNWIL